MSDETRSDALLSGLRALSHFFVGDGTLGETLDKVAHLANDALPRSAMVGITMGIDGKARTAVFTDPASPELDQAQYDAGTGPCLDAYRNGEVNRIPDTAAEERWPEFTAACVGRGVRSTLSLPLVANEQSLGAINFYSHQTDGFPPEDEEVAEAFATQAAIVLANAEAYWDARTLGEQLTYALRSRTVIEQAKGILMAEGRTADEAFHLLVKASQRENRKLHAIAAEIVERAERRTDGPGGTHP